MSRTLLIGLDGGTFAVLDPILEAGLMPTLQSIVDRGARAELGSTPNPLTPAAWTSLATGRSPGQHGIFDFVRVEELSYHPQFRLATSSDIHCPTIWQTLGDAGLRIISLNFPVMFPPRPVRGSMIPGFVPHRHLRQAMHPPELYDRLRALPEINLGEIPVDFEEERRSVQVLERDRYEAWIRFHIRREEQWCRVLSHLMTNDPWDLAAVVFDGVDKLQHICWRFIDADHFAASATSDWERRIRDLCLDYFRALDGILTRLLRIAGPETRVFFASDHGFGPSDEIVYVNTWLAERGHLAWADDAPLAQDGMLNPEGMKTPAFLFDWSRTRAYALTPGSNGIYLRLPEDAPAGARETLRRTIAAELLELRSPVDGRPVVRRAMPREEAFPGARSHLAPDLTLVLRDYGFVSVLRSDTPVRARQEIAGAHRSEGIFLAAGPGLRSCARLAPLSILDVTPALLYSLGQPIPAEFEGRLPIEAFEEEHLARHAPRYAGGGIGADGPGRTETERAGDEAREMDPDGEAVVLERLKALGYVE